MPAAANLSMLGSQVLAIVVGRLLGEWHRSILPTHVVDHEQHDIWALLAVGLGGYGSHGRGHRSQGCECDIAVADAMGRV